MPDIFLRAGEANPSDVKLRDPTLADSGGAVTGTGALTLVGVAVTGTGTVVNPDPLGGAGRSPQVAPFMRPNAITGTGAITLAGLTVNGTGDILDNEDWLLDLFTSEEDLVLA